jgi:SNARE protein
MSEIEDFEEQLDGLVQGVQQVLDNEIRSLRGRERTEKCAYLKNRLVRARQVHRSIIVELRSLEAIEGAKWKAKTEVYDSRLSKMAQDIEWAETSAEADAGPGFAQETAAKDMSAKQMTSLALQTQDKSMATTSKIKNVLSETIEVSWEC